MGSERRRTPVASKIALPIAGARPDNRTLARTRRRKVFAIEQNGLEHGHIAEAGNAVSREASVQDATVFEFNRLEERAAQPHDVRAFNLIAQVVRVDDGSALEGRDHPHHLHLAGLPVHRNFSTGRDVPQLFVSAAHAETLAGSGFGPPPAEFPGGGFEDSAQPFVLQVLQAELERVHFYRDGPVRP